MKTLHMTRISAALIGFALLSSLFASPASAHHRRHHDNYDYEYHPPCHWY